MKVIKGLKKVGAIAGSSLMAAVTLSAAASAADLSDYPQPFVTNGVFDGKLVIGAGAATSDVVGAIDIAASLQAITGDAVSSGAGSIVVANGKVEEVGLGEYLNASTAFTGTVDNTDLPGVLMESSVTITDDDGDTETYDFHEEIQFPAVGLGIGIQTGLSFANNRQEDWEDRVFMPAGPGAIKYCIVFDETLDAGKYLANASSTDPIYLEMLGREMEIQGASATSITVKAGEEFNLNAGESVIVDGHTITLVKTDANNAMIEVDGQREILGSQARTINGIRVQVDDIFNDDGIEFDSATVIAGEDTIKTYNDGDYFIGEDEDYPAWVWSLSGLTGATPSVCVSWNLNLDNVDEQENDMYEHPAYEGDSYVLPFGYASITFDSLQIDDYQQYEITDATIDLWDAAGDTKQVTSARVLKIRAVGADDQGFVTTSGTEKADTVYLYTPNATGLVLYRLDRSTPKAVNVMNYTWSGSEDLFDIDYKQSTFNVFWEWGPANGTFNGNLSFEPTNSVDEMKVYVEQSAVGMIDYVGHSDGDTITANDLLYVTTGVVKDISGWEENTRMKSGIIIEDPDSYASSDKVLFQVPNDITDFKANVVISGSGSSTSRSTTTGGTLRVNPIAVGLAILDTDAAGMLGSKNLIVVGGPCVNTVAANLLDNPALCADGFSEGFGRIQWFDSQRALLVAGYNAADTTAAARVLADYDSYSSELIGAEVQVVTSSKTVQRVTS